MCHFSIGSIAQSPVLVARKQYLPHVAAHASSVVLGPLAHGREQGRLKADVERKHINGVEMAEAALDIADGITEVDADGPLVGLVAEFLDVQDFR
jgi:hypothetical protein